MSVSSSPIIPTAAPQTMLHTRYQIIALKYHFHNSPSLLHLLRYAIEDLSDQVSLNPNRITSYQDR